MLFEFAIAQLAAVLVDVVGRSMGDVSAFGQPCADRLTLPPQTIGAPAVALMIGDEP